MEILSQLKNGHWIKLLARHFLDIREVIYKQLLFVWHQSVFRTMETNLSQALYLWSSIICSNPKIQHWAAHISDWSSQKRDVLFNITLHAAVSISYAVPSKPQYITYDTFMTPWCNRHIYKKAWGWKLGKDKFLSNKHKSLHYSIWANLCYHALYRSSACIIRPIQSALLISCYLCY